ncbi:hypothetical protein D3C72_2453420 [compost metagenome]
MHRVGMGFVVSSVSITHHGHVIPQCRCTPDRGVDAELRGIATDNKMRTAAFYQH